MKSRIFTLYLLMLPLLVMAQLHVDGRIKPSSSSQVHKLVTKRGDTFQGTVMDYNGGKITFNADEIGLLQYDFLEVDSIIFIAQQRDKYSQYPNDHTERVMFTPTAFSVKRGEWEYVNRMVVANSFNYGVRDHYSLGAGVSPLPFGAVSWVSTKLSTDLSSYVHIALGGNFVIGRYGPYEDLEFYDTRIRVATCFGAITIGSRDLFVNFVAAKALYDDYYETEWWPFFYSAGGAARLGNRVRVYAEWSKSIPYYDEYFLNFGFSILGKKSSASFGLLAAEEFGKVPTLGYNLKFGRRKR